MDLTDVMMCITSWRMELILDGNVLIHAHNAGANTVAGMLVAQEPDLFRTVGRSILGTKQAQAARALRRELAALDHGIEAIYASAHAQAHIFAEALFSQKRFWRLYRDIDNTAHGFTGYGAFGRNSGPWSSPVQGFVPGPTPGPLPELELSSRQIAHILRHMLDGLSQAEQDDLALATALRALLLKEIARLAAFKVIQLRRVPTAARSLRDRVLCLEIHTGSSPPATAAISLAACKATSPIAALQVNHATICHQDHRTHRNDPLRRRHPPAHHGGSARDHAASRRLPLPSGHRRHRPHHPLCRDRGALRPQGRGQMVRHVPMVGGFRRLPDPARTTIGLP